MAQSIRFSERAVAAVTSGPIRETGVAWRGQWSFRNGCGEFGPASGAGHNILPRDHSVLAEDLWRTCETSVSSTFS